jgi:hypothetical protein
MLGGFLRCSYRLCTAVGSFRFGYGDLGFGLCVWVGQWFSQFGCNGYVFVSFPFRWLSWFCALRVWAFHLGCGGLVQALNLCLWSRSFGVSWRGGFGRFCVCVLVLSSAMNCSVPTLRRCSRSNFAVRGIANGPLCFALRTLFIFRGCGLCLLPHLGVGPAKGGYISLSAAAAASKCLVLTLSLSACFCFGVWSFSSIYSFISFHCGCLVLFLPISISVISEAV